MAGSVLAEKDLVKELERMAEHLKALDREPDQELLQDQANLILGKTFTFLWKGKGGTVLF